MAAELEAAADAPGLREMGDRDAVDTLHTVLETLCRLAAPLLLPPEHQARAAAGREAEGDAGSARAVADYIAGMTDRYAIEVHKKLFSLDLALDL